MIHVTLIYLYLTGAFSSIQGEITSSNKSTYVRCVAYLPGHNLGWNHLWSNRIMISATDFKSFSPFSDHQRISKILKVFGKAWVLHITPIEQLQYQCRNYKARMRKNRCFRSKTMEWTTEEWRFRSLTFPFVFLPRFASLTRCTFSSPRTLRTQFVTWDDRLVTPLKTSDGALAFSQLIIIYLLHAKLATWGMGN